MGNQTVSAHYAGTSLYDSDPALCREMMTLIDQTIAAESKCHQCDSPVELETTAADQPYEAWLVCTNPECQRRKKLV